jgi:hypothetical protein
MGSFPVTIVNTGGSLSNILTVSFVSNITISSTFQYFTTGSSFITFDGNGNNVGFAGVNGYPGFIQNFSGNSPNASTTAFHTIKVQNINTLSSSGSNILAAGSSWLCGVNFGRNIKNTSGFNPSTNLIQILNCSNSLNIIGSSTGCGGIIGTLAATNGVIYIYNCVNSGTISNGDSGGIVGSYLANTNGTANVVNCSNSGITNESNTGGIIGRYCANEGGFFGSGTGNVTVTGCSNSGSLNGNSGGIMSRNFSGTINISNCVNTGNVFGSPSGGILSSYPSADASVTITNCLNTGSILTADCGGIVGSRFGFNSNKLCTIRNCYNLGNSLLENSVAPSVTNRRCGGIVGSDCGYNTSASFTPNILIENCYNLGSIYTEGGGIIGGTFQTSTNTPNITLNNCYNNGGASADSTNITSSDGLIADDFTYKSFVNVINCYNAFANSWSDSSANNVLTGVPASNKLGTTWTSAFTNKPWVLSSFNDVLYNPNTENVRGPIDLYATTQGLTQGLGIQYSIVSNVVSVSNSGSVDINATNGIISYSNITSYDFITYTTNVIAFKGDSGSGLIHSYDVNSFVLNIVPPPTPVTDDSGLNDFMGSTEKTEAILLNNIEITEPIVSEIPKSLLVDEPDIVITISLS